MVARSQQCTDVTIKATALTVRALARLTVGAHRRGLVDSRAAVQMAGSSGNHYLTLDVLTALAMAEWSTGELDSAALHAEQVATRAGEAGYQQLEGQALITLATIRLSRGSASEAAEHGSRAVAIYRRTGDHLG